MKYSYSLSLWLLQIVYIVAALDEETIKDTLKKFNTEMAEIHREIVKARWDYEITRSGPSEEKLVRIKKIFFLARYEWALMGLLGGSHKHAFPPY